MVELGRYRKDGTRNRTTDTGYRREERGRILTPFKSRSLAERTRVVGLSSGLSDCPRRVKACPNFAIASSRFRIRCPNLLRKDCDDGKEEEELGASPDLSKFSPAPPHSPLPSSSSAVPSSNRSSKSRNWRKLTLMASLRSKEWASDSSPCSP